ncbi:MAG: PAS domain S-box protein [FCB group bacterium]|nr:PAS domain S-box protein [FCB group bacterium]
MLTKAIASLENGRVSSRWHGILLTCLLGVGVTLSVLLFVKVRGWEKESAQADFERLAQERVSVLQQEYQTQIEVLRATSALFAASESVTRGEFSIFAEAFLRVHESLFSLQWVPRVAGDERAAYEESARRDGFSDFHFRQQDPSGAMRPADPRDEYCPVYYVEPYERNEAALGFDNMSVQSPRLEALYRARDTGRPAACAQVALVQGTRHSRGVVFYAPVYRKGAPRDTVEARRRNLEGYAVAVFRVEDLLQEALRGTVPHLIDCHLFDVSEPNGGQYLASHPPRAGSEVSAAALQSGPHFSTPVTVAGRQWLIVCTPSFGLRQDSPMGLAPLILVAGLVITVLIIAYLGQMLRELARIRNLAVQREHAKRFLETEVDRRREAEESLRAISSRYEATLSAVSDIIMEVDVEGRYTWANPAALAFFGPDAVGRPVSAYLSDGTDGCEPLKPLFQGLRTSLSLENWQRDKDQNEYLLSWRCHPLRDRDGQVSGAVLSARDVTAQRQIEDGLRASEARLRSSNRALVTISECNQALVRTSEETELVQGICRAIVDSGGYRMAWVGYADDDEHGAIRPVAWAGENAQDERPAGAVWARMDDEQSPVGRSLREQQAVFVRDVALEPAYAPWRDEEFVQGHSCALLLPLVTEGKSFGVLSIYADYASAFDVDAVNLLSGLANDLAYGISALRTRAELVRALETTQMLARFPAENPNVVFRVTFDGMLLYANSAAAPVLAAWQCEVGQPLPEEWRRHVARSLDEGTHIEIECVCGECIFAFTLAPVVEAGYVNLYGSDITARKHAEEAQAASEARFRVIFESAGMGMALANIQGCPIKSNPALHGMLGYTEAELTAMTFAEFTHPDDVNLDWGLFSKLVENKIDRYQIEKRFIRKDGQLVWVRLTVSPVRKPDGTLLFALGMVEDITAHKRAENERLRLVMAIESAAEAIVVTDTHGVIEYVNPAFERVTGYTREEVVGQNPRILKSGAQDDDFYRDLWHSILRGEVWTGQFSNKRKDGRIYHEDATISPIRDAAGNIVNYVAVKRDTTREVELEQQLRRTQKLEAIGTLAGGIAHDFNNILQSILGFAEVAKAELPENNSIRLCLDEILTAGMRARDLVAHILAFSRQSSPQVRPMKIQSILKEIRGLLRGTIPSTIEIDFKLSGDCGPVLADPTCIHQIVMNLCTNAYHAMRESGGKLTVSLEGMSIDESQAGASLEVPPGAYARLTVADTGHGMPPSVLERVFDPYFTTKQQGQGSGLGLSVVLGIVKELKGAISVESRVGEGSRFEVLLPLCVQNTGSPDDPYSSEYDLSKALRGTERILLVDDEVSILRTMRVFLISRGYDVKTCSNGMEALELVRAVPHHFDVVVTDQTMPQLTGLQLAKELAIVRPDLPVVLCTGYSDLVDEATARNRGLRAFVTKPFTPLALTTAIRQALQGASEGVA